MTSKVYAYTLCDGVTRVTTNEIVAKRRKQKDDEFIQELCNQYEAHIILEHPELTMKFPGEDDDYPIPPRPKGWECT